MPFTYLIEYINVIKVRQSIDIIIVKISDYTISLPNSKICKFIYGLTLLL